MARPVYLGDQRVGPAGEVAQRHRAAHLDHDAERVPAEHAPVRLAGHPGQARRQGPGKRHEPAGEDGPTAVARQQGSGAVPPGVTDPPAQAGRAQAGPRPPSLRVRDGVAGQRGHGQHERGRHRVDGPGVGEEADEEQRDLARQHQADDQSGLGEDQQRGDDVHGRGRQVPEDGDQALHACSQRLCGVPPTFLILPARPRVKPGHSRAAPNQLQGRIREIPGPGPGGFGQAGQ